VKDYPAISRRYREKRRRRRSFQNSLNGTGGEPKIRTKKTQAEKGIR